MCRDSLHIFVKFKRISCKFCYKNQAGFLLKKEKSVYYRIYFCISYILLKCIENFKKLPIFTKIIPLFKVALFSINCIL